MQKPVRGARVGTWTSFLVTGLAVAACGSDKVAHFAENDLGGRLDGAVVHDMAVDAAPQPDVALPDAAVPDAFVPDARLPDAALVDAAPTDAALPDAAQPDAGLMPPTGDLPDYGSVAVTTAGATTYVVWAESGDLLTRAFGADLDWAGPTQTLASDVVAPVGLVADTYSEIPYVVWGTSDQDPVHVLEADQPGGAPIALQVTGIPLVTQLGGQILVFGKAPGAGADRPLAWQVVDPLTGGVGALHQLNLASQMPDAAGSLGDAAVIRFGVTGQCVFFDATAQPIGNFVCKPGKAGTISSDGLTAILVFQDRLNGDFVWRVLPLLGGQAYTMYNLGKEDASGLTAEAAFPSTQGTRPLLLDYRNGDRAGTLGLFFAEPGRLFTEDPGAADQVNPWPNDGTRALVRRGETAMKVRFGYPDAPLLSQIPLHEVGFPDTGKAYNFQSIAVDPNCVPTLEDCGDVDQDCDGIAANGLCCALDDTLRWRKTFTPVAGVSKFFIGDATDRNAYFAAVEGTDGSITPYFIDFTDNSNNVSEADGFVRDIQRDPPQSTPQFDLSHAHDLVGFVQVHAWRGVIAHNEANDLGIFWNPPSIPRIAETNTFSPLDNCEQVLAADRVMQEPYDGLMAAIVVCPDRILRVPARPLDGQTESVPLEAAGGIPVHAIWATTTRVNRTSLMVLVAYQTAEGHVQFLRYLVSPQAAPGAPAGIGLQAAGQNGPLSGLSDADAQSPIYWNVSNTAYVQIQAGGSARARTPNGQGWDWQAVVVPGAVDHYELSDLNLQLIGGAPVDAGYALYTLSVGGDGGTSLWSSLPSVVLPVQAPLWRVTRGYSNDNFSDFSNGHMYPGVFAMYADPMDPSRWYVDLSGSRGLAP